MATQSSSGDVAYRCLVGRAADKKGSGLRRHSVWVQVRNGNSRRPERGDGEVMAKGSLRTEEELAIGYWLWVTLTPPLVAFGTVGNVTSILVLCRKTMLKTVSTTYLIALAVVDLTVLLLNAMWIWMDQILERDLEVSSDILCKITRYKMMALPDFSAWILVCINIERVLSTKAETRYKTICSRKSTYTLVLVCLISTLLINLVFMAGFEINSTSFANGTMVKVCIASMEYERLWQIWPVFHLIKGVILPMCIMVSSSILIIVAIFRQRRHRVQPTQSAVNARLQKIIPAMSVLLLGLNAVFICTNAPVVVYIINDPSIMTLDLPVFLKEREPVLAALTLLMYVNHAVNFVLYCFTGARFRAELRAMLHAWKNRVGPLPE